MKEAGTLNIINNAPSAESGLPQPSGRKIKLHANIIMPAITSKVADIFPYLIRIHLYQKDYTLYYKVFGFLKYLV